MALAAATKTVGSGPSSSSAVKSTTYDTDIVDALRVSGSRTLSVEARHERTISEMKSDHCVTWTCVAAYTQTTLPVAMTPPTYARARRGSWAASFLLGVV